MRFFRQEHWSGLPFPCCWSITQSCLTLCNPMDCSMPVFPVLLYLLEFAQTQVHWVDDAIQPFHPLSSSSPPALNLPQYQGPFQWIHSSYQVAKVFEVQHQSFQWIFRVISFRTDWSDLLAVQGTLKSLLQHHSSKASILHHSAFFIVQLSHPHITTGKVDMATHSSILAWRISWTEEPGGLQSMGSQRVRHDWSNLAGSR